MGYQQVVDDETQWARNVDELINAITTTYEADKPTAPIQPVAVAEIAFNVVVDFAVGYMANLGVSQTAVAPEKRTLTKHQHL